MLRKKLRVALVLSGQPRFVELGWSSLSHKLALRGADVSVFGHVWFDPKCQFYETAPWSGLGALSMANNSIDLLKKQYPGIRLEVESPRKFDVSEILAKLPEPSQVGVDDYIRQRENLPNTASHCYSIHQALRLANEENRNKRFDLYVLSRYDSVLGVFPRLSKLVGGSLNLSDHHDSFPDMIFAGTPEAVNAIDGWHFFTEKAIDELSLVGEGVKWRAFLSSGLDIPIAPRHMTSIAIRNGEPKMLRSFVLGLVHYELVRYPRLLRTYLGRILQVRFPRSD